MTSIVTARGAHDFLAVVPHLIGMQPRDSLVLVAFRGNLTAAAMRFDLPPEDEVADAQATMANTVVGMVCRVPRVDALVPVVYADVVPAGDGRPPRERLIDEILRRAEDSGFVVRDALWVIAAGWGHYPACGDPRLQDHALVESSAILNAIDPGDRRELTDPVEATTLPPVDERTRRRVAALHRRLHGARGDAAELVRVLTGLGFGHDLVLFADRLLMTGGAISHEDAAVLAFFSRTARLRTVILVTWGWGAEAGDEAAESAIRAVPATHGEDPRTAGALGGWGMPRPDAARIELAMGVLKTAAAWAPVGARAPMVAMLGWLNWSLGRGSVAARWVDQARSLEPELVIARLLDDMLSVGHLPEWAFAEPAS